MDDPRKIWRYDGGWEMTPHPYEQADDDHDDALREAGFYAADQWGAPGLVGVDVYEHSDEDRWIVEWSVGTDRYHTVVVDDLPNLVELLSKLATIATASLLSQTADTLRPLVSNVSEDAKRKRGQRTGVGQPSEADRPS